MNKILNTIKNIPNRIVNSYKAEPRKASYARLLVLLVYTFGVYILTMMFIFGRMLVEKVLIPNPENTRLSIETLEVVEKFSIIARFLIGLVILSVLIIGYKEYQELCARKIIKKYNLNVIE